MVLRKRNLCKKRYIYRDDQGETDQDQRRSDGAVLRTEGFTALSR